jgi:hypothetical protein
MNVIWLCIKAKGQYTYWSQRAGNRAPNKGLRLDYFICSKSLMEDDGDKSKVVVRDSFIVPDQLGSDHCPIVLELEIKKWNIKVTLGDMMNHGAPGGSQWKDWIFHLKKSNHSDYSCFHGTV